MILIDYYTKRIVATFNGANTKNLQLRAWIQESGYLVHRQRGNKLFLIK